MSGEEPAAGPGSLRSWRVTFTSGASLELDAPDVGAAVAKAEGIWLRGGVAGPVTRVDQIKPRRPAAGTFPFLEDVIDRRRG
jgi:hypothetical protein